MRGHVAVYNRVDEFCNYLLSLLFIDTEDRQHRALGIPSRIYLISSPSVHLQQLHGLQDSMFTS